MIARLLVLALTLCCWPAAAQVTLPRAAGEVTPRGLEQTLSALQSQMRGAQRAITCTGPVVGRGAAGAACERLTPGQIDGLAPVASTGSAADLTGLLAVDRLPAIPAAKISGLTAAGVSGLGAYVIADTTGASDASAAINALTQAGKTAILPCGTYLLASTIRMADGAVLDGQGCAKLTASATMTANPIWSAIPGASSGARMLISNKDAAGNSNIAVRGVTLVGAGIPLPSHLAAFYKVSNVTFEGNRCIAAASTGVMDCVAFVQSSDYRVIRNTALGFTNACYDQWDGVSDFLIADNLCDGAGALTYGVLINGLSTANTANTSSRGVVRGNIVRGTKDGAIWAGGLCGGSPTQCGVVNDVAIESNIIDGGGYQSAGATLANIGVYVSDGARNRVASNIIRNMGGSAIRVATQASGGATDKTLIADNQIVAAALNPTTAAIRVDPGSGSVANTVLTDNSVDAGGHNYAITIASGVTGTKLTCGRMVAGTAGMIANSGTGGVTSCYDGAAQNLTSPGTLKLGAGDIAGLWTLDGSGNLYPAASGVRSLGFSTNAIGLVTSKQISLVLQTIATLPACNSGAAGYSMAVGNGQATAAAGYGAAVGATTGSTTRRVLCDGAAWVYN